MASYARIESAKDLPQEGGLNERARERRDIDFKTYVPPESMAEHAKDVAAFANGLGGVLLIGADIKDDKLVYPHRRREAERGKDRRALRTRRSAVRSDDDDQRLRLLLRPVHAELADTRKAGQRPGDEVRRGRQHERSGGRDRPVRAYSGGDAHRVLVHAVVARGQGRGEGIAVEAKTVEYRIRLGEGRDGQRRRIDRAAVDVDPGEAIALRDRRHRSIDAAAERERRERTGRCLMTLANRLPRPSYSSIAAGRSPDEWLTREATLDLIQAIGLLEDELALFA
jgi:hypothetical protein